MNTNRNVLGAIFFGILTLIIVFPLFPPGFILSFDINDVPFRTAFPSFSSPNFIFGSIWSFLSQVVSTAILQKIWLFLIFLLSGWGMFRITGKKNHWAGIFAGSLYAINPFVYERVLVGHWELLFGYSLLPFLFEFTQDIFESLRIVDAVKAALVVIFIVSVDIRFVLILAPILIILIILGTWSHLNKIKEIFKCFGVFTALVVTGSLNWLMPILSNRSNLVTSVNSFNVNDLTAFQTTADQNFGLVFNLLSGYGLWTESQHYFILPKDILMIWPLLSLAILSLAILGIHKVIRTGEGQEKALVIGLIVLLILSLDFSGGVALLAVRDWVVSIYDSFPVIRGLREPQKFIGLVMFCYAFLGAKGIQYLKNKLLIAGFLLLPFIYTFTVFGGFWGQLKPAVYPASRSKMKTMLDTNKGQHLVLVFPWHQYMRYRFNNNQAVSNLAPLYFGDKILSSGEYEANYPGSHETRPEALHVAGLLRIQKKGVNLLGEKVDSSVDWAQNLSVVDIKYILLAKEEDWQDYKFLDSAPNLKKIFDDENFILYENLLSH